MPRAPLGLTRPLATTIAAPGALSPAMRRRGVSLSWRRARARQAEGAGSRHDVHHHWPLTVTLLFREDRAASPVPPSLPMPGVAGEDRRTLRTETVLLWEQRRAVALPTAARAAGSRLPRYRASAPVARATTPAPGFARIPAGEVANPRALHRLIEQRWLRTRITRHGAPETQDVAGAPPRGVDRPALLHRARQADPTAPIMPTRARHTTSFSRPMRVERTLYVGDPLVHRSLRRIAVTPMVHRTAPRDPARPGDRLAAAARMPADIAQRAVRPARARAVDQVWHSPRTGGGTQTAAQSFAPVFASAAAPTPTIAFMPPAATPAPPPAPDVNRLVDEVMRRIERHTRQDRLRRGL